LQAGRKEYTEIKSSEVGEKMRLARLARVAKQTSKRIVNLSLATVIGLSGLVAATPLLFSSTAHATNNTFYVRTDGSDTNCDGTTDIANTGTPGSACAFATIQTAVNAASSGFDTVMVDAGSYNDQVTVDHSVTINGAQVGVDGQSRSVPNSQEAILTNDNYSFEITAGTVTINGFKFTAPDTTGIVSLGGSGLTIQDNIFTGINNGYAAAGQFVNATIQNNLVQNSRVGFEANTVAADDATIRNNTFLGDGGGYYAIAFLQGGSNVTISGNTDLGNINGRDDNFLALFKLASAQITFNSAMGLTSSAVFLGGQNSNIQFSSNNFSNNSAKAININNVLGSVNSGISIGGVGLSNNLSNNTYGVYVAAGSVNDNPSVAHNNLSGNSVFGIYNDATSGGSVDASNNWWGTANKSAIPPLVSGDVTWDPWYLDSGFSILSNNDTTGPSVVLSDDQSGQTAFQADSIVMLTATFSDANALDSGVTPTISISHGGVSSVAMTGTADPNVWTYQWTVPSGDATADVTVSAQDESGNLAQDPTGTTSYLIDNTAPTVPGVPSPTPSSPTNSTSQTWNWTASTDVGGSGVFTYLYSIVDFDAGATLFSGDTQGAISLDTTLGEGSYEIIIQAQDNVGLVGDPNAGYLIVDTTAPTVTGLIDDATPQQSVDWNWDSPDGAVGFRYLIDQDSNGVPSGAYAAVTSASQPDGDGTYYLHVQAIDAAGNESDVYTVSAILDNTSPVINLTGPNSVKIYQGTAYLDQGATATDNIDSSVTVNVTNPVDTNTPGNYTVLYDAQDTAGNNADQVTRSVEVIAVSPTQTTIDTTNTVSSSSPVIVIGDNAPASSTITIPAGVSGASLDLSALTTGSSTISATLPGDITVNSANGSSQIQLTLPAGTTISGDSSWDGTISLPTVVSGSSLAANPTVPAGFNSSIGVAIDVGSSSTSLTFDHAARLVLPGQAGKQAGFIRAGVFTEITQICTGDTQTDGDALAAAGSCKIDSGSDLVIWTKHFTTFVAYTAVAIPSSSSGSSSSSSSSKKSTTTQSSSDQSVLGASTSGSQIGSAFSTSSLGNSKVKAAAVSTAKAASSLKWYWWVAIAAAVIVIGLGYAYQLANTNSKKS
jgi:hypothetical protein